MKIKNKLIALIMTLLIVFCSVSYAAAESEVIESDELSTGKIPFVDVYGRSEEEVDRIMLAQHPYLVACEKFELECIEKGTYPDYYAGNYFIEDQFYVVVAATNDSIKQNAANPLNEIYSAFGEKTNIKYAQHSYNELLELCDKGTKILMDNGILGGSVYIDVTENAVHMEMPVELAKTTKAESSKASAESLGFKVSYKTRTAPLTASIKVNAAAYYYKSGSIGKTSSIGPWAYYGTTPVIIGAGHSTDGAYSGISVYTGSDRGTKIGDVADNVFINGSKADALRITVSSGNSPGSNSDMPIKGEHTTTISKGTVVKRYGKTNSVSGEVTQSSVTVQWTATSFFLYNQTEASYQTAEGESGNAVTLGDGLLCGIQSSGYDKKGGPSYFSQWANVKSALSVTLYKTN